MPPQSNPYDVLEATESLCPECLETVPAKLVEQAGKVFLRKHCRVHGTRMDLLEEDAAWFKRRNQYSRPGSATATQTALDRGCPHDCGLCPAHEQHTCIGLIEVTTACDQACTACYADAGGPGRHLDLETVAAMIRFYQQAEDGKAEILQLSGGEPTLHPRILDIIRMAQDAGLAYVMLNTNGRRIAEDEVFVRELAAFRGGFEVYLQFDGLDEASLARTPGALSWKRKALQALERHRVPTTLVMTVQAGVNDHALGDLAGLAMATGCVRGINFQPLAWFGRIPGAPGPDRTTLTGVLKALEAQTRGQIRMDDFVPLPCHVDRVAVNYLYRHQGAWVPVTRGLDFRPYTPFIRNTFNFQAEEFLRAAAPAAGCCGLADLVKFLPARFLHQERPAKVDYINDNLFRLSVVSFLDPWNFDLKAMQKECVHMITPDLRRVPFSAYNLLHRHG